MVISKIGKGTFSPRLLTKRNDNILGRIATVDYLPSCQSFYLYSPGGQSFAQSPNCANTQRLIT